MSQFLFLLGGIVGALVLAFAYITIAANVVANHQDRVVSLPLIGRDLDAFLRALHGAAGDSVVDGNTVEIFQNGDEIFPPMLAAMVLVERKVRLSIVSGAVRLVPRLIGTGVVVLKNTLVTEPGMAWVSTLLATSVRQLVTPLTAPVFQFGSTAPDQ